MRKRVDAQNVTLHILSDTVKRADALVERIPTVSLAGTSRADVWRQALDIGLESLEKKYPRKGARP